MEDIELGINTVKAGYGQVLSSVGSQAFSATGGFDKLFSQGG